jgi:hypothetical protein
VLEQQEPIADPALATLVGELVLELPGGLVGHRPERLDRQDAAVRAEEGMLVARRAMRRIPIRTAWRRRPRRAEIATGRLADVAKRRLGGHADQTAAAAGPGTCSAAW